MIGYRVLAALLVLMLLTAAGEPPTVLRHGINITHWFRFPPSRDPAALRSYLDDAALEDLRRIGFTFIRLPVQPDLLSNRGALADAISMVQRHGMAVVVALFAESWHLETNLADRASLLESWRSLGGTLRRFSPRMTFPEVLNEPVFSDDPNAWATLQHQALLTIRGLLPANTVVLTGSDWGSVSGLLALTPEADANVIYSVHLYEPMELTALGSYRPGLDAASMARLPFPVADATDCAAAANTTNDEPTADLMRFYCGQRWDAAKLEGRISEAGAWARRYHATLLVGEFGAAQRLNARARLAWLTAVRSTCEAQGIGWALWGYDDSMGFALHPPWTLSGIDVAVLRALGLAITNSRQASSSR